MGQVVAISHDVRGYSAKKQISVKKTWANYVKDRWPYFTQAEVQKEWGLTEYQARSVVYEDISLATIDLIYKAEGRTAALLALDILLVQFKINCKELSDDLAYDTKLAEARQEHKRRFTRALASTADADRSFAPVEKRGSR